MKYLVAVVEGKESIFVFPRDVNHDRMAQALEVIRFDTAGGGWNRKYRDGDVISAGFVDLGICHGHSETLKLNSRGPIDTELLRAFRAVERDTQPTETPAGRGVLPETPLTSVGDLIQWHRDQEQHYKKLADMQSRAVGRPFFDAKVFLQGAEVHRAALQLVEALDSVVVNAMANPNTPDTGETIGAEPVEGTDRLAGIFPQGVGVMSRVGKVVVRRTDDGGYAADVHTYGPYDLENLENGMVLYANGTLDQHPAENHPRQKSNDVGAWLKAEITFEQLRRDEIVQAHDARANHEYHTETLKHDDALPGVTAAGSEATNS